MSGEGASSGFAAPTRWGPGRGGLVWGGSRFARALARLRRGRKTRPRERESRFARPSGPGKPGRSLVLRESRFARPSTPGPARSFATRASLARSPAYAGDPAPAAGRSPIPCLAGGFVRAAQIGTAAFIHQRRGRKTRPRKRESRFARPRRPGNSAAAARQGRVSLRGSPTPGTRRRRRAAARSHTRKAVSFAPPKQAQQRSPTQRREPRTRLGEGEAALRLPRPPVAWLGGRKCRFVDRRAWGRKTRPRERESRSHREPGRSALAWVSLARPRREPARIRPVKGESRFAAHPRRGPGTGGGPQPDPIPARRFRSRRPNKHRPLKAHPPTPGTQDAVPRA
ncbi:hypothetical protein HNR73_003511 [Phytomonospora endophytica]|uniref:Uncharacterized protein n=1 Tax=Phytomonospora endophytica TaxID=714109 RepID=A0A841FQV1_9ACTN|nr:hypothetical protein [Phytomonospora endophytica]